MRIRSLRELEDAIDQDLARRKRALTSLKFAFEGARAHQKDVIGYGAVCMLYAHWEGFVKFTGSCFTHYVSKLGIPYQELSNGIVAICIRAQLKGLRSTDRISLNREFVELLRDRTTEKPTIPWKSAIETYGNLNSEVLFEILTILGCDKAPYLTMTTFIAHKLLLHRNRIAHNGHDYDLDVEDFPELHAGVLSLLEQFRDDVQTAARLKFFEK